MSLPVQTHRQITSGPLSGISIQQPTPRRVIASRVAGVAVAVIGFGLLAVIDTDTLTNRAGQAGFAFVAALLLAAVGFLFSVGAPDRHEPRGIGVPFGVAWSTILYVNAGLLLAVAVFLLVRP